MVLGSCVASCVRTGDVCVCGADGIPRRRQCHWRGAHTGRACAGLWRGGATPAARTHTRLSCGQCIAACVVAHRVRGVPARRWAASVRPCARAAQLGCPGTADPPLGTRPFATPGHVPHTWAGDVPSLCGVAFATQRRCAHGADTTQLDTHCHRRCVVHHSARSAGSHTSTL